MQLVRKDEVASGQKPAPAEGSMTSPEEGQLLKTRREPGTWQRWGSGRGARKPQGWGLHKHEGVLRRQRKGQVSSEQLAGTTASVGPGSGGATGGLDPDSRADGRGGEAW